MATARLRRRTIALIAAYALALHGLLLAVAPLGPGIAAASPAVLCTHDPGDGTGQGQPSHDLPCASLCAAAGHAVDGPVPSGIVVAAAALAAMAAPLPIRPGIPPLRLLSGPHVPRGPPLA